MLREVSIPARVTDFQGAGASPKVDRQGDVANGSKHMMQTRAMTRAGGSEQTRNDVTIVVGRGVKHTFYIQDGRAGGAEYEAVDLADLCIAEWRSFLSAHQLDHGLNGFS